MTATATARAFLTTAEIADELGIDQGKVTDWIANGDLQAVNVALVSGGVKPRWRVRREAFEQFIVSRQSQTAPSPAPRRKRREETVTEYH